MTDTQLPPELPTPKSLSDYQPQPEAYPELSVFDQPFYLVYREGDCEVYKVPGTSIVLKVRFESEKLLPAKKHITFLTITLGGRETNLLQEFTRLVPDLKIESSTNGGAVYDHKTRTIHIPPFRSLRRLWELFHEARHAQQYARPGLVHTDQDGLKLAEECYKARQTGDLTMVTIEGLRIVREMETDANEFAKQQFQPINPNVDNWKDLDDSVFQLLSIDYPARHLEWIDQFETLLGKNPQ